MKMRFLKVFAFIISVILVISLSACSSSESNTDVNQTHTTEAFESAATEVNAEKVTDEGVLETCVDEDLVSSVNQLENELEILTVPNEETSLDSPVKNTEDSNSIQQGVTQQVADPEPTLPFEEEIELPFVPAN